MLLGGVDTQGFEALLSAKDGGEISGKLNGRLWKYRLGGKLYLSKKNVKPYLIGEYFKVDPKATISLKSDGTEELKDINDSLQDFLKRINWWGVTVGFGAEYFFTENFSLGGEFGYTLSRLGYRQTWEEDEGPMGIEELNVDLNTGETYTALTLNYQF